jgi:hypothetical protein
MISAKLPMVINCHLVVNKWPETINKRAIILYYLTHPYRIIEERFRHLTRSAFFWDNMIFFCGQAFFKTNIPGYFQKKPYFFLKNLSNLNHPQNFNLIYLMKIEFNNKE